MPPKVTAAATEAEGVPTMNSDEMEFLTICLQNSIGGKVQVDVKAVMASTTLTNPGSVRNKIAKLAKKFNLPIGTGGAAAKKPEA